ncbi:MAG TPA: hypothetical protein VF765_20195 [Polyangiaceae bacterium]
MRTWMLAPVVATCLLVPAVALAQSPEPPLAEQQTVSTMDTSKEDFALGFDLRRFQDDFGIGGTVSSPMLARWVRFTAGGGVAWYPHALDASGNETWDTFGHARVVVEVGPTFQRGIPVRPYGFGGASALFLPSSLSNQGIVLGGVGGFGVELAFMHGALSGPVTYFMEIGGCGYDAKATALKGEPDVASGLLLGAGLRIYL